MENRPEMLTVAEIAAELRVDPESVRRWLRDRKLAGINLGKRPGWRVRRKDLDRFIDERYSQPTSGSAVDHPEDAQRSGQEGDGL
jgi:excisionase family DNA binding protein